MRTAKLIGCSVALFVLCCGAGFAQGWTTREVAAVGEPGALDMALGTDGRPHLCYQDSVSDELFYGHWDGVSWNLEKVVTSKPELVFDVSMALDSSDRPHLTYWHSDQTPYTEYDLNYAVRDGTWTISTVCEQHAYWQAPLVLEGSDKPHIAYFEDDTDSISHATLDGSFWTHTNVDGRGWGAFHADIAIDTGNNVHLSYTTSGNQLKYARMTASGWDTGFVEYNNVCNNPSLMLASGGEPRIAYHDSSYSGIIYAEWTGDTDVWSKIGVATTDVPAAPSLALDSGDVPHIVHSDGANRERLVNSWGGGGYETELIDDGAYEKRLPAFALDGAGFGHVVYRDDTNSRIVYATNAPVSDDSPEPATWLLLACTGIAGAVARRRRER